MYHTITFLNDGLGKGSWKHTSWEYMKCVFCHISGSLVAGKCTFSVEVWNEHIFVKYGPLVWTKKVLLNKIAANSSYLYMKNSPSEITNYTDINFHLCYKKKNLPERGFLPIINTFGKAITISCCKHSCKSYSIFKVTCIEEKYQILTSTKMKLVLQQYF